MPYSTPAGPPASSPAPTLSVDELHARTLGSFDTTGHAEPWKNKVAEEMNTVMVRVQYTLETGGDETDIEFATATLALLDRIAEFEGIDRAEPAKAR